MLTNGRRWLCAFLSVVCLAGLPAQDPAALDDVMQTALQALQQGLQDARLRRDEARTTLARTGGDKAAQLRAVDDAERAVATLQDRMSALVSGVDPQEARAESGEGLSLWRELQELLQPLVREMKDATAEPRQIEDLKQRIADEEGRLSGAQRAQARSEAVLAQITDAPLRAEVQDVRDRWLRTVTLHQRELAVLKARLQQKLDARQSLWEAVHSFAADFFQSRGLNLLLAGAAFTVVFLGLRAVQKRLQLRQSQRSTALRLFDLILHVLVAIGSLAAVMLTFYLVSDWLLLAVAMVFLLGAGWALVRFLPQYIEQLRLMLDLGNVREGERLIWNGLPYLVETLRFYTVLRNPELEGGLLRVPLRGLVGLYSRPNGEREPWFPCRGGEHVVLADGTFGKVVVQTPEQVLLRTPTGERTYPTADFLTQSPVRLDAGFAVRSRFAIDMAHVREATVAVPERLATALAARLAAVVEAGQVRDVRVELQGTGASGLDYLAIVELAGAAAPVWDRLQRAVPQFLVEACNEAGYRVPLPQLVVQQR